MEKVRGLTKEMFENIKPGQTVPFPLEDRTCLNRCRCMIHFANYNWLRPGIEKFTSSWNKDYNVLSVTAVKVRS